MCVIGGHVMVSRLGENISICDKKAFLADFPTTLYILYTLK